MSLMKTKEAAELLGVSVTTVKRWASHFSSEFRKDPLGHYVFSRREIGLLQYIQERIEQGGTLERIVLPGGTPSPDDRAPSVAVPGRSAEWLSRLDEIERSLDQKADEVVSAQVRQHRAELDELRRTIAQLAASIEALQMQAKPKEEQTGPEIRQPTALSPAVPAKKRKLFRTFF
ncbi:MerR family transcriptional regulator [Paenibacillaceae bacterium WGS1546]|uniref:MerR family transcriptional regulator n=1 Tax=Cohnella sp. WGS1546 TaxID=3366810 RepID=UPI00372D0E1B